MQRRGFLQAILGLAAGTPFARLAGAQPKPAPDSRNRRILIQESPLAGFQYYHGEVLWDQLREGQSLDLVREPDNPYDPKAVRVEWNGCKLGYVPRTENTAISQMLDRGECLEAKVAHLRLSSNPWDRVGLVIELATWSENGSSIV